MCGINGFSWEDGALVKRMNQAISYRGPDDTGIYTDKNISLGHNRLSIIDLSKKGHQPMSNKEGTVFISYNGEIYNFKEIREELEKKGYSFASDTDTEVMIYAYQEWGHGCISRFNGMFAFALWDSEKKELFLARDRIGIKPLYYHYDGSRIIFSSEIKAILAHGIEKAVDTGSFSSFLQYRFIASDSTMIKGIKKLLPGHYLVFKDGKISIKRYWSLSWSTGRRSLEHYAKAVDKLLNDAVEKRLMSDVPLGVFLSGGLDSSLITAINARLRDEPVRTFSVGFGHETDELGYASKVSELLSTEHREIVLDYKQLTKSLPDIVWHMDEPNTDITMMPLYFLSKAARQKVTVINTGEGADELFSGYYHYYVGSSWFDYVPRIAKRTTYESYYSPFKTTERKQLLGNRAKDDRTLHDCLKKKGHILSRILHFDIEHELPNWQLTRVDRMSMAHAMEARVPFLDHRMAELASSIPPNFKQRGLEGKHVLKKTALKYLPRDIIYRKKQGFTTPMHAWLKHDLEKFADKTLSESNIRFLNKEYVQRLIEKHKKIQKPRMLMRTSYQLLILTLFDVWHRIYIEHDAGKDAVRNMGFS